MHSLFRQLLSHRISHRIPNDHRHLNISHQLCQSQSYRAVLGSMPFRDHRPLHDHHVRSGICRQRCMALRRLRYKRHRRLSATFFDLNNSLTNQPRVYRFRIDLLQQLSCVVTCNRRYICVDLICVLITRMQAIHVHHRNTTRIGHLHRKLCVHHAIHRRRHERNIDTKAVETRRHVRHVRVNRLVSRHDRYIVVTVSRREGLHSDG